MQRSACRSLRKEAIADTAPIGERWIPDEGERPASIRDHVEGEIYRTGRALATRPLQPVAQFAQRVWRQAIQPGQFRGRQTQDSHDRLPIGFEALTPP
jgi:hypothetical protein